MKILYDHQTFSLQKYGGISRYFYELYSHLLTIDTIHPEISVLYSENSYYQELFHQKLLLPDQKTLGKYLNFGKNIVIYKINEYNCKKQIRSGNFDILHPTYYNPYFQKKLKTQPYVLTVYDMIHELFPDMFKRRDNTAIQKKSVIECAAKIIAISDNTKFDIIRFYDIDPKKIEVIPLATSLQKHTPDSSLNLPQKYILFVGSRGAYKNFTFFINSVSSLLSEKKELCLICAGGGVFSDDELRMLNALKIKKKVIHYTIANDSILSQLYRKAILFVFPSLYEGFGIPMLEAFSCGCPVAASNCSSLPEVGGDAAIYFDPNNSDSIKKIVEDIVQNNTLQDSLRIRGYQRLKLFSWEKTAMDTKKVYENLLSQ
ncbi:MAG: glycosyltransferase family 1 protein [Methanoregula sp.]